jgi:hypothetical protein
VLVEHDEEPTANLTLDTPGDGLFDDERDELLEFAAGVAEGHGCSPSVAGCSRPTAKGVTRRTDRS